MLHLKWNRHCTAALLAVFLCGAGPLWAQHDGPPGSGGPGNGGPGHGDRGPFHPGAMDFMLPPGHWWNDPHMIQQLTLTADQGSVPDMAGPLRPFAELLQSETIAHCGHFMPEEQPVVIAEVITRFFEA